MKAKFKKILSKLVHLNNTPAEIALGIAIGVFIATLPIYGLHTLILLLAALIVRKANKIAMLVGTNISLPPTVPFITWAAYEIGRAIIDPKLAPLTWNDFRNINLPAIAEKYPVLFVGSVVLGAVCAVAAYILTFFIVRAYQRKKRYAARHGHNNKEIQ